MLFFRILGLSSEGAWVSLPPREEGTTIVFGGGAGPQACRMWGLSSWIWDQTWATTVTPNHQTAREFPRDHQEGLTFRFKQM